MAKMCVCAVFDVKVGAYLAPYFCRTRGEAIRMFIDAVKDVNSPFIKHPGDYRLFYLGEFDILSGLFSTVPAEPMLGADEIGE